LPAKQHIDFLKSASYILYMIDKEHRLDAATTGIAGLDKVLRGGFTRNRLYLIEGSPGTGKTTLALQFLREGVRQGEKALYVTLSETKEELSAVASSHGLSLEGIEIYDLAVPENLLPEDGEYTLYHPSEVELGETTKAIFEEIDRVQPSRVVFDSLSEMRLLARDSLRYRRQILAFKQFFIGRQSTVLLLDDHTSQESDRQLESLVHGAMLLESKTPSYGGTRRHLNIIKFRGVNYIGGKHDFKIEKGGMVLFPRLIASNHYTPFVRETLSSGVANLDALTGGGLDTGTATLIMGPAGTGKSSIAMQYVIAASKRGQKAAIFAFDESIAILLDRSAGIGINLAAQVEAGQCLIRQIDPAELSPGEFSNLLCTAVEQFGAKVVVIDSLNGYNQAMPEDKFLTAHMHEMLGYLNQQGIMTIVIVAQHGIVGSNMMPPVDLSYLADNVLLLRYFENLGRVYKAISVIKKRTGYHEDAIRELRITKEGVQVGQELTQFQGVLTGVPSYIGKQSELLDNTHGKTTGTNED
jgi:circadian clock protein KaiC